MMTSHESQPRASISARDIGRKGAMPKRCAQCLRQEKSGLGAMRSMCAMSLLVRLLVPLTPAAPPSLRFESSIEKRQADVHPVVDVGVVVVEFLVSVADAGLGEPGGQDARAVVNVKLVAPAAVDVDAAQGLEARLVLADQVN